MQAPLVECLAMDDGVLLRAADIARACGESEAWVLELVQASILRTAGDEQAHMVFAGQALFVARRVRRLQRDLGVNLEGAALALDLLERIERLEARLRRAGLDAPSTADPENDPGAQA
jgi:chaperone modulatory protein CbpM